MIDPDLCYDAMKRRDPAADGVFFVAVRSTGIYCRPICPARLPLRRNVTFYKTAAAAQEAGYRPCLRCRPESAPDSPAWLGSLASINRALRLIDEGALAEDDVETLATRLGMTGRHLRRLFAQHLGCSPLAVEQTRRIHIAKKLLHETLLPVTDIAFAAGYGSVRRFNEAFLTMFRRAPSTLRRTAGRYDPTAPLIVSLAYRPPLTWQDILAGAHRKGLPRVADMLSIDLSDFGHGASALIRAGPGRTLSVTMRNVPILHLGAAIAKARRHVFSEPDCITQEGEPFQLRVRPWRRLNPYAPPAKIQARLRG
jgi:AraC family transcriptional regulator of adaptative response/methylated-DNA-[protein]-cysteine methyltransferase